MKELIKVLKTITYTLKTQGFPKNVLIIQSHPKEDYCFFICLWRNEGKRKVEEIGVKYNGKA